MMSISTVTHMSVQQAEDRYDELVHRVGDLADFMRRGADYELDPEDAAIYDELRALDFLLGRD